MRLSVSLLAVSLAGILVGAWLISRPAFGLAVIFDSLAVGAWALMHDDGNSGRPSVHEVPTLQQVLDRARNAS